MFSIFNYIDTVFPQESASILLKNRIGITKNEWLVLLRDFEKKFKEITTEEFENQCRYALYHISTAIKILEG